MPLAIESHRAYGGGFAAFRIQKESEKAMILCGDASPPGQHLPFRRLGHGCKPPPEAVDALAGHSTLRTR